MLTHIKGPYGKDTSYAEFADFSWKQVNPKHKSGDHSAWETPDPTFWTNAGYAVVRADERGLGQSPGKLDTMSRGTSEVYCLYLLLWYPPADQPGVLRCGGVGCRTALVIWKGRPPWYLLLRRIPMESGS